MWSNGSTDVAGETEENPTSQAGAGVSELIPMQCLDIMLIVKLY